ncbi:hypothetical protein [Streptomyces sp. AM8-1-1]|uniref:hypothetical protein n=1 Tax=Streptomyces sp. AM8-1-1 TaxID=3075825 RepID=UPI0028C3A9C5|nr:hypothetical protein [Streptomyces sp. AM8-1-1]WNO76800.1 hypothetical protein RPQ07_36515 [Streptomyces sp. AM8-1-1]
MANASRGGRVGQSCRGDDDHVGTQVAVHRHGRQIRVEHHRCEGVEGDVLQKVDPGRGRVPPPRRGTGLVAGHRLQYRKDTGHGGFGPGDDFFDGVVEYGSGSGHRPDAELQGEVVQAGGA